MWDSCVMTWKTFLSLFKINYSLLYYDGEDWFLKSGINGLSNIQINLQWSEASIKNGDILFLDHLQNAISLIPMEELNGAIQRRI